MMEISAQLNNPLDGPTPDRYHSPDPFRWDPPAPDRVVYTRDLLQDTPGYLGEENIVNNYIWLPAPGGQYNQLFSKADIADYDQNKADPDLPPHLFTFPAPAVFAAIMQISRENFHFQSCGAWDGAAGNPVKFFEDMVLTCLCRSPRHPVLGSDFLRVVTNLQGLIRKGRTIESDPVGVLSWAHDGSARVKLGHQLFDTVDVPVKTPTQIQGTFDILRSFVA
jgi:hypothetical protein